MPATMLKRASEKGPGPQPIAVSCLSSSASSEDLVAAVRAAAGGRPLLERRALVRALEADAQAGQEATQRPAAPEAPLTSREREVLAALTSGVTNREIAEDLQISLGTVKAHVCSILAKLGVSDRLQAALWAIEHGVVPARDPAPRPLVRAERPSAMGLRAAAAIYVQRPVPASVE